MLKNNFKTKFSLKNKHLKQRANKQDELIKIKHHIHIFTPTHTCAHTEDTHTCILSWVDSYSIIGDDSTGSCWHFELQTQQSPPTCTVTPRGWQITNLIIDLTFSTLSYQITRDCVNAMYVLCMFYTVLNTTCILYR